MRAPPPIPAGQGQISAWLKWLHEAVQSLRASQAPAIGRTVTTLGTIQEPDLPSGTDNFGLVAARIYNEFEQYLVCYLDGGSPGDGTFDVLKPWGLRNGAILSDDIIGNDDGLVHTVTYQYTSIGVRAALDDAAIVSQQIVWPQYTPDRDVLYCARLKVPETFTPNGESDPKSFTLVDANLDGRRWEVYGNRYPLTLFGV